MKNLVQSGPKIIIFVFDVTEKINMGKLLLETRETKYQKILIFIVVKFITYGNNFETNR